MDSKPLKFSVKKLLDQKQKLSPEEFGKQAEALLNEFCHQQEEVDFKSIITEISPIGIVQLDKEGVINYANRQAEKIFGLEKSGVNGRMYNALAWDISYFDGKPYPVEKLPFNLVRDSLQAVYDIRHSITRPSGEKVYLSINATPLCDDNGEFSGAVTIIQDLTKTYRDEIQLQQAMSIFQCIPSGMFIYKLEDLEDDTTLRMVDANPASSALTGMDTKQCLGKTLDENFPGLREKGIPQKYAEVVRSGSSITIEDVDYKHGQINGAFSVIAFPLPGQQVGVAFENITEKKKQEHLLKENQEKLQLLADYATDFISMHDKETRFTYASPSCHSMLGYDEQDLLGKHAFNFQHPDDVERIKEHAEATLLHGVQPPVRFRFRAKDGRYVWFESVSRHVVNKPGDIDTIIVISRDISYKIEEENLLRQAKDIFQNIPSGIHIYKLEDLNDDRTLRMDSANPATEKLTGVKVEDVVGKTLDESFPGLREKGIPQLYADVVRKGEPATIEDIYYQDEVVAGAFSVVAFPLPDQKVAVVFENITEKKIAQQKLEESEKQFRTLFTNSNDAIAIFKDLKLIDCNQRNLDMFNLTKEEVIGKHPADFAPEKQRGGANSYEEAEKVFKEVLAGKKKYIEWEHEKKDGSPLFTQISLTHVSSGGENLLYTILRDITDKVEYERKLENLNVELERRVKERTEEIEAMNEELASSNEEMIATNEEMQATNEELENQKEVLKETLDKLTEAQDQLIQSEKMASIGILTAGVAHEINNPINFINAGIEGIASIVDDIREILDKLEKSGVNNKEEAYKLVQEIKTRYELDSFREGLGNLTRNIKEGVKRVTEIVASLSSFSRKSDGQIEHTDIHQCLDETLTVMHNQYKNIVEILKDYREIPGIACYKSEMNQVFLNILANAVQAIESEGEIRLKTRYDKSKDCIVISFKDNGSGMDKETLKRIFEPFYTTKPVGKGTGLGLSISYNIVKKHHGDINVKSQPGKGTEFIITLPVQNRLKPSK